MSMASCNRSYLICDIQSGPPKLSPGIGYPIDFTLPDGSIDPDIRHLILM